MRQILEFLRVIIISPEIIIILSIIATSVYYPNIFTLIGFKVKSDQELWKFLPAIPLTIFAWAIAQAKDILFPSGSSSNRILLDWPEYWKLKIRVIISLLLILLSVFASLIVWIFKIEVPAVAIGAVFCGSVAISVITACCLWLAFVNIKQIVDK
jgi:hypothetical protein